MHSYIRLFICEENGQRFFGEGPYRLLQAVKTHGSLRSAAASMYLSYSKAYMLVRNAENGFGFALLQRNVDGSKGSGSKLTPRAEQVLEHYRAYKEACEQTATALFPTYFAPELFSDTQEMGAEKPRLSNF